MPNGWPIRGVSLGEAAARCVRGGLTASPSRIRAIVAAGANRRLGRPRYGCDPPGPVLAASVYLRRVDRWAGQATLAASHPRPTGGRLFGPVPVERGTSIHAVLGVVASQVGWIPRCPQPRGGWPGSSGWRALFLGPAPLGVTRFPFANGGPLPAPRRWTAAHFDDDPHAVRRPVRSPGSRRSNRFRGGRTLDCQRRARRVPVVISTGGIFAYPSTDSTPFVTIRGILLTVVS